MIRELTWVMGLGCDTFCSCFCVVRTSSGERLFSVFRDLKTVPVVLKTFKDFFLAQSQCADEIGTSYYDFTALFTLNPSHITLQMFDLPCCEKVSESHDDVYLSDCFQRRFLLF